MALAPAELPPEPLALAAALLGDLAWRAQRFPDAVYYLDRALGGAAYRGDDDLVARMRLARAAKHAGQWSRARAEAAALAADAEARGEAAWSLVAELELVELDASEGELTVAQTRAERVLTRARETGDGHREAYALSMLGDLAQRRGEPETALTRLRAAAALARRLHWDGQYAVTMGKVADILQARGELALATTLAGLAQKRLDAGAGTQLKVNVAVEGVARPCRSRVELDASAQLLADLKALNGLRDVRGKPTQFLRWLHTAAALAAHDCRSEQFAQWSAQLDGPTQ